MTAPVGVPGRGQVIRALLVVATLTSLHGCGGGPDLDRAMEAVCGDAPLEETDPHEIAEYLEGDDAVPTRILECRVGENEQVVQGREFAEDPAGQLLGESDGQESGSGATLWWGIGEDDGRWIVVATAVYDDAFDDREGDGPPVLDPLRGLGFEVEA